MWRMHINVNVVVGNSDKKVVNARVLKVAKLENFVDELLTFFKAYLFR
jgi:hypothetical protein